MARLRSRAVCLSGSLHFDSSMRACRFAEDWAGQWPVGVSGRGRSDVDLWRSWTGKACELQSASFF